MFLKQSTAITLRIGPFLDDTDGKTAETGLTIANTDIRLSKAGGAFGAKNSGGGTHDEKGFYSIALDATDTNTVGAFDYNCHMAGALPVFGRFFVLPANVYDSLAGTDNLEVDVKLWNGAAAPTLLTAGSNAVTITAYEHGTVTPIADYFITFWNSAETVDLGTLYTGTLGTLTCNLNNGTYKLRGRKLGMTADNAVETLVVAANPTTKTIYATPITIGAPAASDACRIYEWCYKPDGATPLTTLTATARIIRLPHDYSGKLHAGTLIDGTYDSLTGKVYWDIAYDAQVEIQSAELYGDRPQRVTVPRVTTARIQSLI